MLQEFGGHSVQEEKHMHCSSSLPRSSQECFWLKYSLRETQEKSTDSENAQDQAHA